MVIGRVWHFVSLMTDQNIVKSPTGIFILRSLLYILSRLAKSPLYDRLLFSGLPLDVLIFPLL